MLLKFRKHPNGNIENYNEKKSTSNVYVISDERIVIISEVNLCFDFFTCVGLFEIIISFQIVRYRLKFLN